MTDVMTDLMKLGTGAGTKFTSFVICKGTEPRSAEEVVRHLIECPECRKEVDGHLNAERDGRYINKTGWWDSNRSTPLYDYG